MTRLFLDGRRDLRRVRRARDGSRSAKPFAALRDCEARGRGVLATYNRLNGSEHTILRYANVYGPRQDPHGEAGVVGIFLGRIARGERPHVFGDGTQQRDYTYVRDVATATVAAPTALRACSTSAQGRPPRFSISSLRASRRAAARSTRCSLRPVSASCSEASSIPVWPSRALGFRTATELADGIAATWEFIQREGEDKAAAN